MIVLIADDTVMRNMHVGHDPVVVAQNGLSPVLHGAATDRTELANRVAITDDQVGGFVGVFLVLRVVADRSELIDVIVLADLCRPIDDDMTVDASTACNFYIVTDNGIRTDDDVVRR